MNKNVRIGGVLASILVIGLIFALVGCSGESSGENGGSSETGEYKPTPERFFTTRMDISGDVRQGKTETFELTDFEETDEIWEKYKGLVVVPTKIDGRKIDKYNVSIFSNSKFLDKLVIPDASLVEGWLFNEHVTSVIVKGTPKKTMNFHGCDKLQTLTIDEVGKDGVMPRISGTSIESFVVPKDCKYIPTSHLKGTKSTSSKLKCLKCPKGVIFVADIHHNDSFGFTPSDATTDWGNIIATDLESLTKMFEGRKPYDTWDDDLPFLPDIVEFYDVEP